jgi:hypothetical protein
MALYQFDVPLDAKAALNIVKSACEKTCKIKKESLHSLECKTHTVRKHGSWGLPEDNVVFRFAVSDNSDGTSTLVCVCPYTGGALYKEKSGDCPDKHFNRFLSALKALVQDLDVSPDEVEIIAAVRCDSGLSEVSTSTYKNVSIGRALVGGALFGDAGAVVGGLSGKKHSTTASHSTFSGQGLFRIYYSNGRLIEKAVLKNSSEYAELLAISKSFQR